VITLLIVLVVIGFIADAFSGFSLTRESRPWLAWLLGIVGLGTLYLLGEGVAEWIHSRDNISDPLVKRIFHLALLLVPVIVFGAASASLFLMTQ
jgi:quinol-cytochrome oxidoreductase complex cytochrome b subunit